MIKNIYSIDNTNRFNNKVRITDNNTNERAPKPYLIEYTKFDRYQFHLLKSAKLNLFFPPLMYYTATKNH